MDEVFRALADPTRRSLLDALFHEDGQTLDALQERFEMTRFGVMKHLRVLEEAGLVVTRRRGREKVHFLNPVPVRLVHDRWVSKYAEPWTSALGDLKRDLEKEPDMRTRAATQPEAQMETQMGTQMEKVYEIYIRTTPERLWEAITDGGIRSRYTFGAHLTTTTRVGEPIVQSVSPSGPVLSEGITLELDPPRRLVQTMQAVWNDEVRAEGVTRVTWEIEQVGDSCRLLVTHDQLREGANPQVYGGWPMILSGLKTWLETGELLTTPGSLMYS